MRTYNKVGSGSLVKVNLGNAGTSATSWRCRQALSLQLPVLAGGPILLGAFAGFEGLGFSATRSHTESLSLSRLIGPRLVLGFP